MNRKLNSSNVKIWLDQNLSNKNRIKACSDYLDKVPKAKGIYFWFINPKGYEELSTFINIKALPSVYQVHINGKFHDLVYLGTAGARNNKSGTNNGNIFQRLQWHITDNQGISALCNGTMSTFRRTLVSLLASDLIENNIQDRLNEFICKYFHIYYVEYVGEFAIVQDQIEKDEELLIKKLKPIFNLSKNPNNKIPNTITHSIGKRRQSIEKKSKAKWCNTKAESLSKASAPTKKKTKKENITSNDDCIEFKLNRHENIATKAAQIEGLPKGLCTIELFYENRNDIRRYINGKIREIRTENRSVSSYFKAPDPTVSNKLKWQIVQVEMNDKKKPIESITVRVCRIEKSPKNESNQEKNPIKQPVTTLTSNFIDNLIKQNPNLTDKTQKKLLIIGCCDAKSYQPNNLNNANYINYDFGALLDITRQQRMLDYMSMNADHFNGKTRNNAVVNQAYFMGALNQNNRRPVFSVYGSNNSPFFNPNTKALYINKIQNSNLQILIVSGLYGLLHHSDYINDYHLEINTGNNIWGNTIANSINDFINQNSIENRNVFYCLSSKYLPFIGQPQNNWTNLWRNLGGRGHKQAQELFDFLSRL